MDPTKKEITELARELRKKQTPAEQVFWKRVRNRQFYGYKITRQKVIAYGYAPGKMKYYIVDFYCHSRRLIIEIDGSIHEQTIEYDQDRQALLEEVGYCFIRFTNEQVLHRWEEVQEALKEGLR